MTNTLDNSPQIPISFSDRSARSRGYEEGFGIWSCKFSADGNEVVAGGSGKIFGSFISLYSVHNLIGVSLVYDLVVRDVKA